MLQAEIYKTNSFLEKYSAFKIFLKSINNNIPIIIFGSFAKFKADKNSDVDILIVSDKGLKLNSHLLPNKTHVIDLTEESFIESLKQQEPIIKEIEENHIVLNNHSFFVNTLWGNYGK